MSGNRRASGIYRLSRHESAALKDEAAILSILAKIKRRTGCDEFGGCQKQMAPNPPGSASAGCHCLDLLRKECGV